MIQTADNMKALKSTRTSEYDPKLRSIGLGLGLVGGLEKIVGDVLTGKNSNSKSELNVQMAPTITNNNQQEKYPYPVVDPTYGPDEYQWYPKASKNLAG